MRDVPLGTLIFRAGLLAEEQLEDALQEGMRTGKRLGEVLAERGLIEDTDLGRLLAGQQGLPYVEAGSIAVDRAALERLPENIARMQNALSFAMEDGVPVVAVADPTNELVVENVRRALGVEPRLVVAAHGELANKIQEAYSQAPEPVAEPAPAAPAAPAAPVAVEEAPVAVEQPAPVAVAQPEAASAPAVTPMPTSVPPAEERTPEPEVPAQPLVAAPVAASEVPPLHAQAAAEPPLAPEPAVPAPAPVAAPAPEAVPAAAPAAPVAPVPVAPAPVEQPAEPVVIVAETPEAPPAAPAPEQPAEPGLFAPAAEQALATPVAAEPPPAPAPQEPAPTPAQVEPTHLVLLRLNGEDRVEIGAFGGQDEAESFARTVVGRISRAEEQAEWPLFGDRFIRPQSIVSVDVVERAGSSWMGSPTRAQWGEQPTPDA